MPQLWSAHPPWIGNSFAWLLLGGGPLALAALLVPLAQNLRTDSRHGWAAVASALVMLTVVVLARALHFGLLPASPRELPAHQQSELATPARDEPVEHARVHLRRAAVLVWPTIMVALLAALYLFPRTRLGRMSGLPPVSDLPRSLAVAALAGLVVLAIAAFSLLGSVHRARAEQGLDRAPRWTQLRRPSRGDLRRLRRTLVPQMRDWPEGTPPFAEHWKQARDSWVCFAHLRQLAAAAITILLATAVLTALIQPFSVEPLDSWPVMVFAAIVAAIALALAHALELAVREVPNDDSEAWVASRDRALSLARIRADARNFLAIYVALFFLLAAGWVLTAVGSLGLALGRALLELLGVLPPGPDPTGPLLETVSSLGQAVQPYSAGLLALTTLGALALVNSAYKELAVLRADVAHRARASREAS